MDGAGKGRRPWRLLAALSAASLILLGVAGFQTYVARSTLHRFFATQAWARYEQGNYLSAARYALAGMKLAPENAHLYSAALASAMHEAGESASPLMHDGAVVVAAFSPDGGRIVTASRDNTAKVWDAHDGRLLATLRGHEGGLVSASFSPGGARIVTASADNTAKIWDARDGRLLATLSGHADGPMVTPLSSAAFSSDGGLIVTASWGDNTAKVWDARDGRLLATLSGHEGTREYASVPSAAFSPDGARIVVTASQDSTAQIWDVRRLTQPWEALARDACLNLLGPHGRRFSQSEIEADPLLISEWSAERDVCEGVPGVPPIAELRVAAAAEAPTR